MSTPASTPPDTPDASPASEAPTPQVSRRVQLELDILHSEVGAADEQPPDDEADTATEP